MTAESHKATQPASWGLLSIAVGVVCLIGALLQIWLLWFSEFPLGVQGEWVWSRVAQQVELPFEGLIATLVGAVCVGYLFLTTRQEPKHPRHGLWLMGLVVLGCVWVCTLLCASPAGGGMGRSAFVLFYPRTSGYYHQAKFDAQDLSEFLKNYETEIRDQTNPDNYLHIGTHPPGLTVCHWLLISLCHQRPELSQLIERTQPTSVKEALRFIRQTQQAQGAGLSQGDTSALWLAVLITHCLAVLTVVPLYFLALRFESTQAARWTAASWLLVPAMLVFLPKSDAAFPCLAMLLQWLWLLSLERNSLCYGGLTALVFTFAATLSLAFFTILVILFGQLLWHIARYRKGGRAACSGVLTGGICLIVFHQLWEVNLLTIWLQNFRNHGAFYDHNTRSYWQWLVVNLLEGGMALGAPLAVCAIIGSADLLKREYRQHSWVLCGLLIWGVLWVSGKNMGEAARLWLFLMPYALLAATPCWERLCRVRITSLCLIPILIVALQALVCLLTAIQVDGFGFTEL